MPKYNLAYLAKPPFGGWVSFTAHLALIKKYPLYKVSNRSENKKREFGYGIEYQNLSAEDLGKLPNLMITCIDKKFYHVLPFIPDGSTIVIHDPTELKPELLEHLPRFKIITIRKTVNDLLKKKYQLKNKFLVHPFYPFEKPAQMSGKNRNLAISRIDFDKNTHVIIEANDKLPKRDQVEIYGAMNDLYVFHKLTGTNFKKYYKGKFGKRFEDLMELLVPCKYMVDLSSIKHDGGGSQYTFLEAIYMECVLVLNTKWVDSLKTEYKNGYNCFVVSDAAELRALLKSKQDLEPIKKNAMSLLKPHIEA